MDPAESGNESGPTAYSTGLGLPLSRALAKANNGWLGLEDSDHCGVDGHRITHSITTALPRSHPSTPASPAHLAGSSPAWNNILSASTLNGGDGLTFYWAVLEAPPVPPSATGTVLTVSIDGGGGGDVPQLSRSGSGAATTTATTAAHTVPHAAVPYLQTPPNLQLRGRHTSKSTLGAVGGSPRSHSPVVTPLASDNATATTLPVSHQAVDVRTDGRTEVRPVVRAISQFRVVFVDDEAANCRLGVRLLGRLGIPAENVTVLTDGTSAAVVSGRCVDVRVFVVFVFSWSL